MGKGELVLNYKLEQAPVQELIPLVKWLKERNPKLDLAQAKYIVSMYLDKKDKAKNKTKNKTKTKNKVRVTGVHQIKVYTQHKKNQLPYMGSIFKVLKFHKGVYILSSRLATNKMVKGDLKKLTQSFSD